MSFTCPELSGFQAPEIRLSHHHYLWKHPHHEKARVGAWLPEALFRLPFGAFRRQIELILFASPALAVLWRGNNYFEQLKYKLCSRSPTILTVPVYNAMRTNLLVFEACTIVVIWLLYCYVSPKIDLLVHEIDQYTQESALARTKTYESTSRWNKSDISGDFYGWKFFFFIPWRPSWKKWPPCWKSTWLALSSCRVTLKERSYQILCLYHHLNDSAQKKSHLFAPLFEEEVANYATIPRTTHVKEEVVTF